jgi:hypothetical protein
MPEEGVEKAYRRLRERFETPAKCLSKNDFSELARSLLIPFVYAVPAPAGQARVSFSIGVST